MTDVDGGTARYAAFLSYSHKDAAAARWLHRKLETYRVPRRLVGAEAERGVVPARLTPIFRDREELPAAGDLSEKVRAALAASDNLIILCSPNSAASPWVGKEIAVFRELHPGRPIFAAIVDGEPDQCFPSGLAEGGAEPLAADLRPGRDGRRLGFLKLVAGLTGVGLDALVQRDAQRRLRRVTAVTAAAVAAMLVMAVLTAFALSARSEAERQRAQAEGLVEFMLTDLRDKLEGAAGLKVLTAVNQQALDYYQGQDLADLSPNSLERRARILHLMGEDDEKRGLTDRALAQFREAARTTAALLAADPDNPDRVFAHSQSEFWIGLIDFDRRRYSDAKVAFQRYKAMTDRLVAMNPSNPIWLKEAAYADGNLCSIALQPPLNRKAALRHCSLALARMAAAARALGDPSLDDDLQNRHGWMADAWKASGEWDRALGHRRSQERILRKMLVSDSNNIITKEKWILFQIAMADFYAREPNPLRGREQLREALALLDTMIAFDPDNKSLAQRRDDIERRISTLTVKN